MPEFLQTIFTVMSGDKAILPCPIQPGALLQQYSVRWMKGSAPIAKLINPHNWLECTDTRYQIDRGSYSLIINYVTINDTSTDYECELFVRIPHTDAKHMLQSIPSVTLSLKVISKS